MIIKLIKSGNDILLNYEYNTTIVEEKIDYDSIEKMIDFIMENDIKDCTVETNTELIQYVDLINSIIEKIKTEDFKKAFEDTKTSSEDETDELDNMPF